MLFWLIHIWQVDTLIHILGGLVSYSVFIILILLDTNAFLEYILEHLNVFIQIAYSKDAKG